MDTVLHTLIVIDNISMMIARKRARHIAALLYFDLRRQSKIATVVYELLQHASLISDKTMISYYFKQSFSHRAIKIKICAKNYSIPHGHRDIYNKLMDKFEIVTYDKKTEITIEKNLPSKANFISKMHLAKIKQEMNKNSNVSVFEEIKRLNKELLLVFSTRSKLQEDTEKLVKAEKISSMGEMATIFAHELNQPLATIATYIQGSIRHLKNNIFKKQEILQVMKLAVKETQRVGDFIHRVKSFVRNKHLSKENTDFNQLVHETVLLLEEDIKKSHVHINLVLSASLPDIYVDAIQIKQALMNIIRSMLQSMKNTKTLSPIVTLKSFMTKNNEIEIDIIDNGLGFKKHSFQLLLDSDLTLKKGLNMDLSIARTIIEAHKGKLLAKPHSGNSTCFQCILPMMRE